MEYLGKFSHETSRSARSCSQIFKFFAPMAVAPPSGPAALHGLLEAVFCALALGVLLPHAWGQSRRLRLFLAALVFGMCMETLGCYVTGSHAHAQFTVQITPYLPLKEDLWYALLFYPSCLLAEDAFPHHPLQRAVVVATLVILNDAPYEFTNSRKGVEIVAINHNSFDFGDTKETIMQGSALVILSFLLCAWAFGLVATSMKQGNAVIIGVLSAIVACIAQCPFQVIKYLGCSSLVNNGIGLREGFIVFHKECLSKVTNIKSASCIAVVLCLFFLILWGLKSLRCKHLRTRRSLTASRALARLFFSFYFSA